MHRIARGGMPGVIHLPVPSNLQIAIWPRAKDMFSAVGVSGQSVCSRSTPSFIGTFFGFDELGYARLVFIEGHLDICVNAA